MKFQAWQYNPAQNPIAMVPMGPRLETTVIMCKGCFVNVPSTLVSSQTLLEYAFLQRYMMLFKLDVCIQKNTCRYISITLHKIQAQENESKMQHKVRHTVLYRRESEKNIQHIGTRDNSSNSSLIGDSTKTYKE